MKIAKAKAIELLRQQLAEAPRIKALHHGHAEVGKWREKTRCILGNLCGEDSSQLARFDGIRYSLMMWSESTPDSAWQRAYVGGMEDAEAQLEATVSEVESFWADDNTDDRPTATGQLALLFDRFHIVARQLRSRHGDRQTLDVSDEYDVQDLLHALLRLYFDDIRPEEWTPSYAGGASRMDFILNEHGAAIEVKKTRKSMTAKDVGEQLLVDVAKYKEHPKTKSLFCFIYDPEGLLPNPSGMERDLSRSGGDIPVTCVIRPK